MSFAVETGFAFRLSQRTGLLPVPHVTVVAELQLVVYSFDRHVSVAESTETATRSPELDSHAIAACPSSGVSEPGLISTLFPHPLPSQIHALMSLFVVSPPTSPIWLLPFFEASLISVYWMSVEWPVSSRYCSELQEPPVYVRYAMS